MPKPKNLDPRTVALELLDHVLITKRSLSDADRILAQYSPSTRARAKRLASATLRNLDRADAVLDPFLHRRPPERVKNVLRLAVVEISMFQAPNHGVVDFAVGTIGKRERSNGLKKLANAVLRNALDNLNTNWKSGPNNRLPS